MSSYIFPVSNGSISSGFGMRSSPGGIGSTNHKGIDIAAPFGTPVLAPIGGEVLYSGAARGYGSNFVKVRGDDGYIYEFGHMSAANVQTGMRVGAGQQIGAIGSEGNSTGNHLHLGIKDKLGKFVDPKQILTGAKKKALDFAKGAVDDLLGLNPATAPIKMGADLLGINPFGDNCGIICQIKNWIRESGFFQRLALAILAFIILLAAFYLMKDEVMPTIKIGGKTT